MRPEVFHLPLRLAKPFRIAHGTSDVRTNAVVRLGAAFGEAGLPPYLGTDVETVAKWIDGLALDLPGDGRTPAVHHVLQDLPDGPRAARCALDLALHDLWGTTIGRPLYELFGLDPARRSPPTFVTLSIPESLEEVASAAAAFGSADRLKLKVGSGDPEFDLDAVRAAREATRATIAVDANGAWSVPEAVAILPRLLDLGLAFVEQPIPAGDAEDWHLLRRLLPRRRVPQLFADESVSTTEDVIALAGAADGVNVKLAKCGGLALAREVIAVARSLDLGVLIGCMIESSLAIAAAAHIAPLADWVDLDAPMLILDDPFDGVRLDRGRVLPTDRPGIGAVPTDASGLFQPAKNAPGPSRRTEGVRGPSRPTQGAGPS